MLKLLAGVVVAAMMSGAAIAGQFFQTQQERDQKAADAAIAECDSEHKAGVIKTWVGTAECVNAAQNTYVAKYLYADLLQLVQATNMAIATKLDAGAISKVEARAEYAEIVVQAESEAQRRDAARSPAFIFQPAAPTRSQYCTSSVIGNMISTQCF